MTSIASRTQLPPSPELHAALVPTTDDNEAPPSSLNVSFQQATTTPSSTLARLRSVARYGSFQPSTLATSHVLIGNNSNQEENGDRTSLAAVAGRHGVAIFTVAAPQTPLCLLHHAVTRDAGFTSLAFGPPVSGSSSSSSSEGQLQQLQQQQPQAPGTSASSLLLAGSRGSAVLVWDIDSGQALRDRLEAAGAGGNRDTDSVVRSVTWGASNTTILACTESAACLWDLRQANRSKPTVRFGETGSRTSSTSAYVQVVHRGGDHTVALLETGGVVRLWDWRYMPSAATNKSPSVVATMDAFSFVGVGLQACGTSGWVVWGCDRGVHEAAVAKVFCPTKTTGVDDWTAEGSSVRDESLAAATTNPSYSQIALLSTPNLACARAQDDHVVTVGVDPETAGWTADVWKIRSDGTAVDPVISFRSPQEQQSFGRLCAAELALSSFPRLVEEQQSDGRDEGGNSLWQNRTSGLLLVNLTEEGYVTTHSIPEVMEALPAASTTKEESSSAHSKLMAPLRTKTRIIPDDRDVGDVARSWGVKQETLHERARPSDDSMPFDMDVPVAYSIPSSDVQTLQKRRADIVSPTGSSVGIKTDSQDSIEEKPARLRIDTREIPCPRLCGAIFGAGGLTVFSNGEVKRMWTWYSSTNRMDGEHATGRRSVTATSIPENLKSLQNMMKAAKDAQWGENTDGEASSVTSQQLGLGFFEDESDEESSDASHESDEIAEMVPEKGKGIYETYFGDFRRPLTRARASSADSDMLRPGSESGTSFGADPSSDVLAPVVKVSRAFDMLAMHHQSKELALALKLGDLALGDGPGVEQSSPPLPVPSGGGDSWTKQVPNALTPPRFLLPGYRMLGQSLGRQSPDMMRVKSAPVNSLQKHVPVSHFENDDRSVHGGEYAVRPQMKESIVFLKKLVNYQQESGGIAGSSGYRGLMSPPDGPMIPRASRHATSRPGGNNGSNRRSKHGAYVLRTMKNGNDRYLLEIRHACEHNATVCMEAGEPEKAETWKLLAQIVAGRLHLACGGRWKPRASLALGANLVRLVLAYYESMGDAQMLSTIVCVLRQEKKGDGSSPSLLPEETDGRYDGYLRKYSEILYCWGLLSLRAELNKHLKHEFESREVFGVPSKGNEGGISLFSKCPHCHEPTSTNYCNACSNYAFRCTICDTAVRGLFTVCSDCGHGGHTAHLQEWFKTRKQCPTGCGCLCALVIPKADQRLNEKRF